VHACVCVSASGGRGGDTDGIGEIKAIHYRADVMASPWPTFPPFNLEGGKGMNTVDYRCEDGSFPKSASCMTISTPRWAFQ
jgi:hypothetical protein